MSGNVAGRGISRGRFLRMSGAGLAGLGALGVSACGGGESGGGSGSLVFAFFEDPAGGVQTLIDRFNGQNEGGIKVTWRKMPAVSDDFFDQVRTQFQAGDTDIDIIGGDIIWPAQFASQGYILDLSDRFPASERGKFLPAAVDANVYNGGIYGVPWFTDAGMFYYRKDLIEQADVSEPPKTYDELKQMGRAIQQETGTRFGYVFQGAADEGGVVDALEYIWNFGGDVLDGDQVIIDSPEAAAGLDMRRSMVTDRLAPQAITTYGTQESQAAFTNGDAVFMRNWPFVYDLLADPELSKVKPESVGIAAIPYEEGSRSYSGLGGWNMFINAASEKQDEAWEFVKFMTSPESQRTLAVESSRLPTLESLYEDDEVLEKVPVAELGKEAIQNTRPRPTSPYYSDMSLEMMEQFNAALKGEKSSEATLAALQSRLQSIVEQGQ